MLLFALFSKLLNMSLTASVVIFVVLLLRLLLKKAPKIISYSLWGLVLFRLLCPVSIGSALSLFSLLDTPITESGKITNQIEYIPDTPLFTETQPSVSPSDNTSEPLESPSQIPSTAASQTGITEIAAYIWIAGVSGMGLYAALSYVRLYQKRRAAVWLRDNIYLCDKIPSPFVFGLFRPNIYLPSSLDEKELPYIIMHEKHHIHRRDHIVKLLAFAALCVHWWNPLVWVAFYMASQDMEMSCDEAVIQKMGDGILADYAASLLGLSTGRRMVSGMPLAFGEGNTKTRIRNLANWKQPKRIFLTFAFLLVIFLAVVLVSNPAGTVLTKWTIDEIDMSAALSDVRSMTVRDNSESVSCNDGDINRFIATMGKIRVGRNSISQSRDSNRDHSFTITINDNLHLHFSFDFSEIWVDNGVKPSFSYPITNPETARELILDFSFTNRGTTEQWFDYFDNPEEMQWDGRMEANIPEFPDVTFRWTPEKVEAVTGDTITPLYTGMPIWSVFFADLTGDGLPELCSTVTIGSGIGDDRIIVYDYANSTSYTLQDRKEYDYSLSMENGWLIAQKQIFRTDKKGDVVKTGYLIYKDGGLQILSEETASSLPVLQTTYRSDACLYMNPLSSFLPIDGDSGFLYRISDDGFETVNSHTGAKNWMEVSSWEWKTFPYTDEEWDDLFFPKASAFWNINEQYDQILYLPLTAEKFLLLADRDLLLVELASDPKAGTYLWSIYTLVPKEGSDEAVNIPD